jgi:transposase
MWAAIASRARGGRAAVTRGRERRPGRGRAPESGQRQASRHPLHLGWPGAVRAVLYMATLAATRCKPLIRPYYQRLRALGKPQKVALMACLHKLLAILNAMLRDQTPWRAPARA